MGDVLSFVHNITMISGVFMLIGIILLFVEMFQPGFGVAGISGIICLLIGIFVTAKSFFELLIMLILLFILLGVLATVFLLLLTKTGLSSKFVLSDKLDRKSGFTSTDDMYFFMNKTGKTLTTLRPAGMCDFDGVKLDVLSEGEYIEKNTDVIVVKVEGGKIVVRSLG